MHECMTDPRDPRDLLTKGENWQINIILQNFADMLY